jgi:cytosine deaminase
MSTPPNPVSALRNVRPWGGEASDIRISSDGEITLVEPARDDPIKDGELDGRGLLALAGLVNAHAHIDMSWFGFPWQSYGGEGGTEGRIRYERERRGAFGYPSADITKNVLAEFVRHGTTTIRTHVDVDPDVGVRAIDAVREAAASYDGALTVELIAFPQDGVLRRPGVLDDMRIAAQNGVDHLGGIDPASIDRDPVGQLDAIFGLAAEYGTGIDIHLHDPGDLGAFQFELIIARTEALGLTGKVNIAHGFAIAQIDERRRRDLLQAMGALDITMTTVAPLRLPQLPLHEFDDAGVRFAFGTDGIRDLWSPYGTGDLLGIAWQYARSSSLVRDEDLRRVVEIATRDGGRFAGLTVHDIVPGSRADIVLMDAENPLDAHVRTPPRRLVRGAGRVLHTA